MKADIGGLVIFAGTMSEQTEQPNHYRSGGGITATQLQYSFSVTQGIDFGGT
jgi:hypothetical protein